MKDFVFSFPTKIIFGKCAEDNIGQMTALYGKHALILYGSSRIEKNGLLNKITKLLEDNNVSYETYGGICENPLLSDARAACDIVKEKNIDCLIAVGGGSVIDTAKTVAIGSCTETPMWDFFVGKMVPERALPIGVVLTMAATASEANGVAVLTNEKEKKKTMLFSPHFYPKFALLNPELTYTVPAKQTAIGAVDIFAHAFERYFDLEQKNTLRNHLCVSVMKTVLEELPKVQNQLDDYASRSQLMWSATMAHSDMIGAGGVFVCHEISHILTEEYGIPHGLALGILMPAWCKYMLLTNAGDIARFAEDVFDVMKDVKTDQAIAQEGISKMQQSICDAGLPVTLREAGIMFVNSKILARKVLSGDTTIGNCFRALSLHDIEAIIELAKG